MTPSDVNGLRTVLSILGKTDASLFILGEGANILAGGQSLMPTLNMRLSKPNLLIGINQLDELSGITVEGDMVRIGALSRHAAVLGSQIVAERLHAEDPNWGRRINVTGPIGKDTVAYKASDGRPYSIDIVAGAGGSNPKIHWDAHGFIGGTWIVP